MGPSRAAELVRRHQIWGILDSGSVDGLGDENFYFSPGPGDVALLYIRLQNLFIAISALVPDGLEHATHLAELALSRS